jgi:hypothetical protein
LDSIQRQNADDIHDFRTKHIRKLQGMAGTLSMVSRNRRLLSLAIHEDDEDTLEAV